MSAALAWVDPVFILKPPVVAVHGAGSASLRRQWKRPPRRRACTCDHCKALERARALPDLVDEPRAEPSVGVFGARKPHEPSRMVLGRRVTVDDVLAELVGRVSGASNVGPQLDQARGSRSPKGRPLRRDFRERGIPREDIADAARPKLPIRSDPWQAIDRAEHDIEQGSSVLRCVAELATLKDAPSVGEHLRRHVDVSGRGLGEVVVQCLRAYQERAREKDRALAEVVALFSLDTNKTAASLHAECLALVRSFVGWWNRKHFGVAEKAKPLEWMRLTDAAARWGMSERTLRRDCAEGKIGKKRDGLWITNSREMIAEYGDPRPRTATHKWEVRGGLRREG